MKKSSEVRTTVPISPTLIVSVLFYFFYQLGKWAFILNKKYSHLLIFFTSRRVTTIRM